MRLLTFVIASLVICSNASASAVNSVALDLIGIDCVTNTPQVMGSVVVVDNPNGPDIVVLGVGNQPPNTRLTVFMAQAPGTGSLPAQLLGEFKTDPVGDGNFSAITEVINAKDVLNPVLTKTAILTPGLLPANIVSRFNGNVLINQDFLAPGAVPPGAVASGGDVVQLDFFRVYVANSNSPANVDCNGNSPVSVFGGRENETGGRHLLSSSKL